MLAAPNVPRREAVLIGSFRRSRRPCRSAINGTRIRDANPVDRLRLIGSVSLILIAARVEMKYWREYGTNFLAHTFLPHLFFIDPANAGKPVCVYVPS